MAKVGFTMRSGWPHKTLGNELHMSRIKQYKYRQYQVLNDTWDLSKKIADDKARTMRKMGWNARIVKYTVRDIKTNKKIRVAYAVYVARRK